MRTVTILMGVPGSGKSWYVSTHCRGAFVVSVDHYFERLGRFDWRKLGEAHGECLREFIRHVQDGTVLKEPVHIVVDNTNTKLITMAPYVAIAQAYGYHVEVVRLECDPKVAAKRCVHEVPEKTIIKMDHEIVHSLQFGLPEVWGARLKVVPNS